MEEFAKIRILQPKSAAVTKRGMEAGTYLVEKPDGTTLVSKALTIVPLMRALRIRQLIKKEPVTFEEKILCESSDAVNGFRGDDASTPIECKTCEHKSPEKGSKVLKCSFKFVLPVYLVDHNVMGELELTGGNYKNITDFESIQLQKFTDQWRVQQDKPNASLPMHRLQMVITTRATQSSFGVLHQVDFTDVHWIKDQPLFAKVSTMASSAFEKWMPNTNHNAIAENVEEVPAATAEVEEPPIF